MFLARSRLFAGGLALSLLVAGGCAPSGRAGAEAIDEQLTVSGDIFDRPGSDNPCHGQAITLTPGRQGDTSQDAEIARGLIEQCRPALTYEELLYRYALVAAERDEARAQLQAMATEAPYPAYSSGLAHPAAPVIYEQDLYQPPAIGVVPVVPVIVPPRPVYVSPPPAIIVTPPRPHPPHYRPPHYRPPHHRPQPSHMVPPPVVHRPQPGSRPPPAGSVGPPGQPRSTYGR